MFVDIKIFLPSDGLQSKGDDDQRVSSWIVAGDLPVCLHGVWR